MSLSKSTSICVITKTFVKSNIDNLIKVHNVMRNVSNIYPGCLFSKNCNESKISTNSSTNLPSMYLTNISLWNSYEMWKNWENSTDKWYITKDYNKIIEEKVEIFKYI